MFESFTTKNDPIKKLYEDVVELSTLNNKQTRLRLFSSYQFLTMKWKQRSTT